ncbi:MAG: sugar phosphate isomerase/epimerase family protein [Clostridia bacterium]
MMKNILSCSTHCYNRFPFERALKGIAASGLGYVEIGAIPGHCDHVRPEAMSPVQVREALALVAGYGLKPSSISGHCDLTTPGGAELFKKRMDFAVAAGAGIVNTAEGNIQSRDDEESFFRNMKELAAYAKERGLLIALETHGGILGTAKRCIETLDRIGSEHVKINYDPANLIYFEGKDPETDILEAVDHIGHMHIKDQLEGKGVWNFPAIGEGTINFRKLFIILAENGYAGPLSFEIEFVEKGPASPEEVDQALIKSVRHVKSIMKEIK